MKRYLAVKLDEFYVDLVDTIRSRARQISVTYFYCNCRSIYGTAREYGVTEHDLHTKINKAARVTRYFSPLKLWKDCTSPDPIVLWLEHDHAIRHAIRHRNIFAVNNSDHDSDKDSTTAQASQDSDD
jgi:hypothetical protein